MPDPAPSNARTPAMDPRLRAGFEAFFRRDVAAAQAAAATALKERPDDTDAMRLAAMVVRAKGQVPVALEMLVRALRLRPEDPALIGEYGLALLAGGRAEEAVKALAHAAELLPGNATALFHLGRAQNEAFDLDGALRSLQAAAKLDPANPEIKLQLGIALLNMGLPLRAIEPLAQSVDARPGHSESHHYLGSALRLVNDVARAQRSFERALELRPESIGPLVGLAQTLEQRGEFEAAAELLERHRPDAERHPSFTVAYARIAARVGKVSEARALLDTTLTRVETFRPPARAGLYFSLGRMLEEQKDFDGAFRAFRQANEQFPARYDRTHARAYTDRIMSVYSLWSVPGMPRASVRSELPIFIVGMPRSGTSLVEQILGAHPLVAAGGELRDVDQLALGTRRFVQSGERYPESALSLTTAQLDEMARRHLDRLREIDPAARHVTDKMPHNFRHLGLIRQVFPGARVIHCTRHPADVCVSCYTSAFSQAHRYANRLADLAFEYREYARLMKHWSAALTDVPLLELPYEELTRDQEGWTRRLLEFCGLDWHEGCLRFYESERVVHTASMDQVRKPIYHSSVARYRRYEAHLAELLDGLGDALPAESAR
ncbi:MAG: sulfotransferase [Phycisphaerae bacterium]|nr:sulfotransferase [Phycisphaerae bacterium]